MLCLGKDFNGDILRSDFFSFSIFLNNVIKSLLDVEERNLPRVPLGDAVNFDFQRLVMIC